MILYIPCLSRQLVLIGFAFYYVLGRYRLKLSSEARDDLLRAALKGELQIGDQMEVIGSQKRKDDEFIKE